MSVCNFAQVTIEATSVTIPRCGSVNGTNTWLVRKTAGCATRRNVVTLNTILNVRHNVCVLDMTDNVGHIDTCIRYSINI